MQRWLNRIETIPDDHPLYGCRLKFERADKHRKELEEIIGTFAGKDPYRPEREFDPERKIVILRACLTEAPPPHLPLVVGDCIHNLRSALDYAVNELVIHFGHKPSKTTAFPIFSQFNGPSGYACRSPAMLAGLPPEVCAEIDAMQPYHGADATIPARNLAALHELWNKEKHRALLLTKPAMWFKYIGHDRTGRDSSGITARLTDSEDCAEYVATDATSEEHFDPKFAVEVRLAESRALYRKPVVEVVSILDDTARQVVERLRPFFG